MMGKVDLELASKPVASTETELFIDGQSPETDNIRRLEAGTLRCPPHRPRFFLYCFMPPPHPPRVSYNDTLLLF